MADGRADDAIYRAQAAGVAAHMDALSGEISDLEDKIERLQKAAGPLSLKLSDVDDFRVAQAQPVPDNGWKGGRRKWYDQLVQEKIVSRLTQYGKGVQSLNEHVGKRLSSLQDDLEHARSQMAGLTSQLGDIQRTIRNMSR